MYLYVYIYIHYLLIYSYTYISLYIMYNIYIYIIMYIHSSSTKYVAICGNSLRKTTRKNRSSELHRAGQVGSHGRHLMSPGGALHQGSFDPGKATGMFNIMVVSTWNSYGISMEYHGDIYGISMIS